MSSLIDLAPCLLEHHVNYPLSTRDRGLATDDMYPLSKPSS